MLYIEKCVLPLYQFPGGYRFAASYKEDGNGWEQDQSESRREHERFGVKVD